MSSNVRSMVRVSGLIKRYPGNDAPAVNGINFEVGQGEFFTLLGPSGCGKSTVLRCIAGLESADGGEIAIDGQLVSAPRSGVSVPSYRRGIGMVFQSYAIWPHKTVGGNVSYPLQVTRVPKTERRGRVQAALKLVGLAHLEDRPASRLSGGQQQRVALARAIVGGAKVILLDEPLSNLDAQLRIELRKELRKLQRELNMTMIYVTHDQDEALSLSDRIAVMRHGVVSELGTSVDLYRTPRKASTARFVGDPMVWACIVNREIEPGIMEIDTPLGKIVAKSNINPVPPRAMVVVRPDDVSLASAQDGVELDAVGGQSGNKHLNTFRGTIRSVEFRGAITEYLVNVGSVEVSARVSSRQILDIGREVLVRFDARHCAVLEDDITA